MIEGEVTNLAPKLVAMAMSLEELDKKGQIHDLRSYTCHLLKKVMKIGPIDTYIIHLQKIIKILRKEINATKTHSPPSRAK